MKIHFTLLLLLVGLFMLPSCLPEFNTDPNDLDDKWKPNFALPLLDANLSIQNALNSFETGGAINTDPNGLIILAYRGAQFSVPGGQFFNLPDLQLPLINNSMTVPVPFTPPTELDNIRLKGGLLIYSVSSTETQSINIQVSLPDFTIGGAPYVNQYIVPASNGSNPVVFTDTVSMVDMNLSFTGGDFRVEYTAVRADGQQLLLPNSSLELLNMNYSYIDGYFGSSDLNFASVPNTIDLFTDWSQGNIQFEDPRVNFNFSNSYGTPLRLTVDSFSMNTRQNGVMNLQSTALSNGFDLSFPSLAQVGQSRVTTLALNATNSNIGDILNNVPYEFYYKLDGQINPDNNASIDNFVLDTSAIAVSIDVELPLYGSISQLSCKDTTLFDFSAYRDFDRMKIKTNTENGFPFEVSFQVYFLDENNAMLDSLYTENTPILGAALVDANGAVTNTTTVETEAVINEARYANLKDNSKKMVIVAYLKTTNGGAVPVKIFTDYTMQVRLGAVVGI